MSFLRTIGECFTLRGKQQRAERLQHSSLKCIQLKQKENQVSARVSVCRLVTSRLSACASAFCAGPIHQPWVHTRSASSLVDTHLCSRAGPAPVVSLAQIHFVTFVACCRLTFLLSLHCWVLISPRRQFSKMWLELGSMMQEDWNWPPDCSRETGNRLVTPCD